MKQSKFYLANIFFTMNALTSGSNKVYTVLNANLILKNTFPTKTVRNEFYYKLSKNYFFDKNLCKIK